MNAHLRKSTLKEMQFKVSNKTYAVMQIKIHSRHKIIHVLRNSSILHIQSKRLHGIKVGIISYHLKIPLPVKPIYMQTKIENCN
jgi:hypothetical protein